MMYFAATVFPAPLSPLRKDPSRGDVISPTSPPHPGVLQGGGQEQGQGVPGGARGRGLPPALSL